MTDEAVETSDTPVWVTLEDVLFASVLVAMRNAIQHSHPPESEESTINAVRQIAASSLPAEFRQSLRGLSVANHVSHQSCQMDSSYNSMEQQLLEARLEIKLLRAHPKNDKTYGTSRRGKYPPSRRLNMAHTARTVKVAKTFGLCKSDLLHVHFIDICLKFGASITTCQELSCNRYAVQLTTAVVRVVPQIILCFHSHMTWTLLKHDVVTVEQHREWHHTTDYMCYMMLEQIKIVSCLLESQLFTAIQLQQIGDVLVDAMRSIVVVLLQYYAIQERHYMHYASNLDCQSNTIQLEQRLQQCLLILCGIDGRLGSECFHWIVSVFYKILSKPSHTTEQDNQGINEIPAGLFEVLWWLSQHLDMWITVKNAQGICPEDAMEKLIRLLGGRNGAEMAQQHHVYVGMLLLYQRLVMWNASATQ